MFTLHTLHGVLCLAILLYKNMSNLKEALKEAMIPEAHLRP